jgi:hypothetical protein
MRQVSAGIGHAQPTSRRVPGQPKPERTEALFYMPGAGLPAGTEPLAEPAPWGGLVRPWRLLYPEGTTLTVRGQGEDADQTWQGSAAGAVAAAGGTAQGRLQAVLWPWDESSAVHPALTCPAGTDPYAGLSDRDRSRWERFDFFEAANGAVAYLPCHLVDPGDVIEMQVSREQGPAAVQHWEVLSRKAGPRGTGILVTLARPGRPAVAAYTPNTPLAVVIPATHPAQPDAGPPAADAGPPAQAAGPAGDGSANPGSARAAGQGGPGEPGPLADGDVAMALRRMPAKLFSRLAQAVAAGKPPEWAGYAGGVSGLPGAESGTSARLSYESQGIRIEITSDSCARSGTVTWPQAAGWLAPGLTPARLRLYSQASTVHSAYHGRAASFAATGQHDLYVKALRELTAITAGARDAIIGAARAAHQRYGKPGAAAGRRQTRPVPPAGQLFDQPDPGPAGGDPAVRARLAEFAAVLPDGPAERPVPLSRLHPGDVVCHAGDGFTPYRLLGPPDDQGDYAVLRGQAARPGATPVTWQFFKNGVADPSLRQVVLPGSLQAIIDPAEVTAPSGAAGPPGGATSARPGPGRLTAADAEQLIARARDISHRRSAATPRIDYDAMRQMHRWQKAALTRAVKSGDPAKVVLAVARAVQEWGDHAWPDDWALWQRALDDVLGFGQMIDIRDLADAASDGADSATLFEGRAEPARTAGSSPTAELAAGAARRGGADREAGK